MANIFLETSLCYVRPKVKYELILYLCIRSVTIQLTQTEIALK